MKRNKLRALRDDNVNSLRIGMIGVGGIAQDRHIPTLLALGEKVKLTAVCDVNQERALEVAANFHIPHAFSDYNALFLEVDAVVICTPNKFHAEIAVAALEAGVHVLCEKPMAMTVTECEAMLDASKKSGKLLSVAYHYRHTEAAKVSKATLKSGEVGDPLVTRIQALRRRKVPGWGVFTNKELQGGGSLIDYGCHLIDLSLWLLGDPKPKEVMGTTYNRLSKTPNQINEWGAFDHETFDVDDHVSGYITFEDGSSLLLECSWAANIKEDIMHLSISGTNGGLNVYPFELYQPRHGTFLTSEANAAHNEIEAGQLQAANFVDSCLGYTELVVQPEQALEVSRIIEAIYQSSETHQSVRL